MSLSEEGTINQDFGGVEIGGWGSCRMEENGAHNDCLTNGSHKTGSISREALKP